MKILILTSHIGGSATGIVTKNIIEGLLLNEVNLHVLNEQNNSNLRENDNLKIHTINYKKLKSSGFYSELSLVLFSYPLNEIRFINKATKKAKQLQQHNKFDVIMVLSSAAGYHLLQTGLNIKNKLSLPLYIHSTDPIPAPKPWYNTQSLRSSIIFFARRIYKKVDFISLSNKHMLAYQKKIMGIKKTPSFVVHNPSSNTRVLQYVKRHKNKVFLYVGSIYHQRQPDTLIESFDMFSKNKEVELWFLGNSKNLNLDKYNLSPDTKSKIKCIEFQKDPSSTIAKADVLVDFDANFQNDVFISSKLITYLNTNIPILSLTPKHSPTDKLLDAKVNLGVVKMYYRDDNKEFSFQNVLDLKSPLPEDVVLNRNKILFDFDNINITSQIVKHLQNEL